MQLCGVPHRSQQEHRCGSLSSSGEVQQPGSPRTNSCSLRLLPTAANSSMSQCWAGHCCLLSAEQTLCRAQLSTFHHYLHSTREHFPHTGVCDRQKTFHLVPEQLQASQRWSTPQACQCLRGIWTMPLIDDCCRSFPTKILHLQWRTSPQT